MNFDPQIWQAVSGIASVLVAIVAIALAVRTDHRSEKRIALQHAPLLNLHTVVEVDRKAIVLINKGLGPARIDSVEFRRGGQRNAVVAAAVLDVPELRRKWSNFRKFSGPATVVAPSEEIVLLELRKELLLDELRMSESDANEVLTKLGIQIGEMQITVEHSDVFGDRQPAARLSQ